MTNRIAFILALSFSILFGVDTPKEIDSPSQIITEIQFDAEVFQQNLQIKKGMIQNYKQARKAKRIPKPAGSPIYISNQKSGKTLKKETPAKKVLENEVHLEKRVNAKQNLDELIARSEEYRRKKKMSEREKNPFARMGLSQQPRTNRVDFKQISMIPHGNDMSSYPTGYRTHQTENNGRPTIQNIRNRETISFFDYHDVHANVFNWLTTNATFVVETEAGPEAGEDALQWVEGGETGADRSKVGWSFYPHIDLSSVWDSVSVSDHWFRIEIKTDYSGDLKVYFSDGPGKYQLLTVTVLGTGLWETYEFPLSDTSPTTGANATDFNTSDISALSIQDFNHQEGRTFYIGVIEIYSPADDEDGMIEGMVFDNNGNPLSGASVTAYNANENISVMTNETGYYNMSVTDTSTYRVYASSENFWDADIYPVTVGAGDIVILDFTLMPEADYAWIIGVVQDDMGNLVSDAVVTITGIDGIDVFSQPSDWSGSFYAVVAPGTYNIHADGELLSGDINLEAEAGMIYYPVVELVFSDEDPGWLITHVFDLDGNPLEGAEVGVWNDEFYANSMTDEGGHTIMEIPPGYYEVDAQAEGFEPGWDEVEILSNEETIIEFWLEPESGGSIGTEFEFETIANLYEAFGDVLATEGSGCDGCPGNLNEMEDVASFPIFRQDSFEAWASDSGFTAYYFQFIDENETGEYDDGEIYAVSCEGSANSNNMTVAYNGSVYNLDFVDFWMEAYDFEWESDENDDFEFLGELNGHEYYVSNFESTWNDANNMFNEYYEEVHLVTISSQEENDFVQENVGDLSVWIGFTDEAEEGNWQWVTGEEVVYTNWNEGEPNNMNGEEHWAQMFNNGSWNDFQNASLHFVVEVVDDTTGGDYGAIYGSVQDMYGSRIPYAEVQAWNYNHWYAVTTDENGDFFMEVPAGYYDMEAWAPGYSSEMNWVEVYPNEYSWVEFWLYPEDDYNTLVHGHVHDVDGNPLSFANVNASYLYDEWESEGTFTNEDGYYELYLRDDAYRITAGAEGFWVSAYDSIYVGGDSLWLDFMLSPVGEFDGGWQGNINLVGNHDPELIFLAIMSEDYQVFRILYEPGPQEVELVNGSYHLIAGADGYQEVFIPNAINIENNVVNFDINLIQEGLLLPPQIEFAGDVPNDQGRQMRLVWNPGVPGDWGYFEFFSIWRQVNEAPMILWDFIDVVPWHGMEAYSAVVPTLGDSTDMGIYWSTFRVTGHTENPNEFYDSAPVSGYSIDNLHPGAPGGVQAFTGGEGILLTWDSSMDEDFGYHRIYRHDTDSGDPAIEFTTVDTFYVDDVAEGNYEYWITAVDLNGNESDPSIIVTVTLAIDNGLAVPMEFALQQNYPNPFNPSTQIQYALPTDANVTIAIYDLVGRQIRTLVNEQVTAGYHSTLWNATNDMGSPVSAGVYIYTITANDFRDVKKMILLK